MAHSHLKGFGPKHSESLSYAFSLANHFWQSLIQQKQWPKASDVRMEKTDFLLEFLSVVHPKWTRLSVILSSSCVNKLNYHEPSQEESEYPNIVRKSVHHPSTILVSLGTFQWCFDMDTDLDEPVSWETLWQKHQDDLYPASWPTQSLKWCTWL